MKINFQIILIGLILLCTSCKKNWLDGKPSKALVAPSNVADYQALLDNSNTMNTQCPTLSMIGDGDYYITNATYNSIGSPYEKGAYVWAPTDNFYGGQPSVDWISAYGRILQSNVVLDGLPSIQLNAANNNAYNNVKGSALFFRCWDFFNLSQQYCKAYNPTSATTDLGLPLRVSSDVNSKLGRASVEQTYNQITNDLKQAVALLPATPLFQTRPSKAAAYGLLAKVFLCQANYGMALLYADSCLQLQNGLMDFNQLTPGRYDPGIPKFNKEIIFWSQLSMYTTTDNYVYIADSTLTKSYAPNDLRNSIFFFTHSGHKAFWGTYIGDGYNNFGGLATDEIYLIRAECYARTNNTQQALNDLNTLLKMRWKTGTYVVSNANNPNAALSLILQERRKELCFRNIRWSDLRRLTSDPKFQVTLTRFINGQTYTLQPGSPRYVLPLDPIETTSGGLQQNSR